MEEIGGCSVKEFTPDSFIICVSRTSGLAFRKAYEQKNMSEVKHFEAQYKLFLIGFALDCYENLMSWICQVRLFRNCKVFTQKTWKQL